MIRVFCGEDGAGKTEALKSALCNSNNDDFLAVCVDEYSDFLRIMGNQDLDQFCSPTKDLFLTFSYPEFEIFKKSLTPEQRANVELNLIRDVQEQDVDVEDWWRS